MSKERCEERYRNFINANLPAPAPRSVQYVRIS